MVAQKCLNLAAGSHTPEKRPNGKTLCPDSDDDPDIRDLNLAPDNADTLSIMAGGMWFSDRAQCSREIAIKLTSVKLPTVDNADGYMIDDSDDTDLSGNLDSGTVPQHPCRRRLVRLLCLQRLPQLDAFTAFAIAIAIASSGSVQVWRHVQRRVWGFLWDQWEVCDRVGGFSQSANLPTILY